MQLEIRTTNYLDSLQDQFVDFPIIRKEIKEVLENNNLPLTNNNE